MLRKYWGAERFYHHTAPINMIYALHEALRSSSRRALRARFARHRAQPPRSGGRARGDGPPRCCVQEATALPMLNAVRIPDGRRRRRRPRAALLSEYGIEIGGGLGPLAGKVWRIGLMGESSTRENVVALLNALEKILKAQGVRVRKGAAGAAEALY